MRSMLLNDLEHVVGELPDDHHPVTIDDHDIAATCAQFRDGDVQLVHEAHVCLPGTGGERPIPEGQGDGTVRRGCRPGNKVSLQAPGVRVRRGAVGAVLLALAACADPGTESRDNEQAELMMGDIAYCASNPRAEARLACYDELSLSIGIPANTEGASLEPPRSPSPAVVSSPCDGPRPYRTWSNAELSAAMVRTMGTAESEGLIAEVACRQ